LQNEKNPPRTETFRKQIDGIAGKLWNDEYAIIGPSGEFKDWRGKPDRVGADRLVFWTSACPGGPDNVGLETGSLDFRNPTGQGVTEQSPHIPLASPLGQTLAALDMSKAVIVSGKFIWAFTGASPETRAPPRPNQIVFCLGAIRRVSSIGEGAAYGLWFASVRLRKRREPETASRQGKFRHDAATRSPARERTHPSHAHVAHLLTILATQLLDHSVMRSSCDPPLDLKAKALYNQYLEAFSAPGDILRR
jgi:hypothetical protein